MAGTELAAGWLVVAGRVDDELADMPAGGGVADPGVPVLDEDKGRGAGVLVAGADVVEPAVDAQGELVGQAGPSAWSWVRAERSPGSYQSGQLSQGSGLVPAGRRQFFSFCWNQPAALWVRG